MSEDCPTCNGKGYIIGLDETVCEDCDGTGKQLRELTVGQICVGWIAFCVFCIFLLWKAGR